MEESFKRSVPRVLVVSNNVFSKSGSNGRTLANMFIDWDRNSLAQFYIENNTPDFDLCSNYYRITDRDAVNTLIGSEKGGKIERVVGVENNTKYISSDPKKIKRTSLTMLLRNAIWDAVLNKLEKFYLWVEDFRPDIIFFQTGDSPFMITLVLKISEKIGAPIVSFNTESYCFKDYDYFISDTLFDRLLYPLFRKKLRRLYDQFMRHCKFAFYSCEMLMEKYEEQFGKHDCDVLYTMTDIQNENEVREKKESLRITYLGNLGVGRSDSLLQLGKALSELEGNLQLEVYGKTPTKEIRQILGNSKGIKYCGLVPYEEVVKINKNSDIVVHVENFNDFYRKDLQFAFSTKIADLLATGRCIVLYAPEEFACTQYLKQNNAAYVVTNENELKEILALICSDSDARNRYVENALRLCEKNHRRAVIDKKVKNILNKIAFL